MECRKPCKQDTEHQKRLHIARCIPEAITHSTDGIEAGWWVVKAIYYVYELRQRRPRGYQLETRWETEKKNGREIRTPCPHEGSFCCEYVDVVGAVGSRRSGGCGAWVPMHVLSQSDATTLRSLRIISMQVHACARGRRGLEWRRMVYTIRAMDITSCMCG